MMLLDTDTVSLFQAGQAQVVERMNRAHASELVATTIVTQAEVLRARFEFLIKAADGDQLLHAQRRLTASERLLADFHVVRITAPSAAEFERLRLQKKLKKIGRADLLIASIALSHDATLVTRNLRHFRQITGLKLENWAD